jgi:cytochrome c-type biogenesis protein CcmH/NrfF
MSRAVPYRPLTTLLLALALTLPGLSAANAAAVPRTSLPAIESQVMCATCKIPLTVAQSPQADRERAFIRGLIGRGFTEAQIKRAMVSQYGPAVLALPRDHGFDRAAYIVPLAVVVALLAAIAVVLPRWRRHARSQALLPVDAPSLSSADAARLEEDLARYDV